MAASTNKRTKQLLALAAAAGGGYLAWQHGERWLRDSLIYLSQAGWARQIATETALARQVASRFVAGETIAEAIDVTQKLNAQGLSVTLDYLGEYVTDAEVAVAARDEIARLLDAIAHSQADANVSIKPTQLGLAIDPALVHDNMRYLLQKARGYGNKIRLDMEDSGHVDATLELYRRLRDEDGLENVGVVIQSYLYRSGADVDRLVDEGGWVRLVKGAYAEPETVAFPQKRDTDSNYVALMHRLLGNEGRQKGVYAGIATHDEKMIQATIQFVKENQIPPEAFEFQMLYGVRRDRQLSLTAGGYQMRIYVPYGEAWYPYFMRRLAERPANLYFFASKLIDQAPTAALKEQFGSQSPSGG